MPAGNPEGFTCNTSLVGHHGDSGGYKALRFTDKAGRECAYYDTTLLFPTNAQTLSERPDRRRRARHDRPREPEADGEPAHARDADPARVACCSTRGAACSPP